MTGTSLVKDVAAQYKNVVVVIHTVGPIDMEPWVRPSVCEGRLDRVPSGPGSWRVVDERALR